MMTPISVTIIKIVVVQHHFQADDRAVPVRHVQCFDPFAAAGLDPIFAHRGSLAVPFLRDDEHVGVLFHDIHFDDGVAAVEGNPFDAGRGAAHGPHVLFREADRHAVARADDDFLAAVRQLDADQFVVLPQIDGDQPDFADVRIIVQRRLLHDRRDGWRRTNTGLVKLFDRNDRLIVFALLDLDQIDDRRAAGRPAHFRNLVRFEPVHLPFVGEKQRLLMGIGNEQMFDEIVFFRPHADHAACRPASGCGRWIRAGA